jgi:hypothetical protein
MYGFRLVFFWFLWTTVTAQGPADYIPRRLHVYSDPSPPVWLTLENAQFVVLPAVFLSIILALRWIGRQTSAAESERRRISYLTGRRPRRCHEISLVARTPLLTPLRRADNGIPMISVGDRLLSPASVIVAVPIPTTPSPQPFIDSDVIDDDDDDLDNDETDRLAAGPVRDYGTSTTTTPTPKTTSPPPSTTSKPATPPPVCALQQLTIPAAAALSPIIEVN